MSNARRPGTVAYPLAYQDALLCLKTGDREQYQRLCAGLIRAAGKEIDPQAANNIAMVCALGPDAVPDWRPVVALMEHQAKVEIEATAVVPDTAVVPGAAVVPDVSAVSGRQ